MSKDAKNVNYIFRMTQKERDELHDMSNSKSMKTSQFLRMLIDNYKKNDEGNNDENNDENNDDGNVYTNLDFESIDEDFEW